MTKIPTVNVFLASEKEVLFEVLRDLRKTGGTPQSAIEKIDINQRKGILLFNNYGNPNFISFEHSFNNPSTEAKLKFIDPENRFEQNYLATGSIYRAMAAVARQTDPTKVNTRCVGTSVKECVTIDPLDAQKLNAVKRANLNKPLFVAYGVGDNYNSWSGVHKMIMKGLTFDPEGSREFTLTMVGGGGALERQGGSGLFKQPIDFNAFGNTIACVGTSEKIDYVRVERGQTVYGSSDGKYQPIDYHQLIVDTLVSYFRSATNGANIILLLPDLNVLLRNRIEQINLDYSGKFKKEKFPKAKQLLIKTANLLTSLGIQHFVEPDLKGVDVIPTQAAAMSAATKATDSQRRDYVANSSCYARLSAYATEGTPDLMAPIRLVLSNINKYSSTSKLDVAYFTETNQEILEFWGSKENKGKYTFNGFDEFNPDKPTYVIGHTPEISKSLFSLTNIQPGTNEALSDEEEIQKRFMPLYYKNAEDLDRGYKKRVLEVKKQSRSKGAFGSRNAIPDEFGYEDDILSREALSFVDRADIPVFRHNTSNPNVLKIKLFDDTALYMSVLKAGYKKQVDRVAAYLDADGRAAVRVKDFPIKTEKQLVEAIQTSRYAHFGSTVSKEKEISKIVNSVDSSLENELSQKAGEQIDIAKLIKSTLDSLDGDSLEIKIGQTVNANPAQLLNELANQLGKKTTRIQIKSLPMFELSTRSQSIMAPAVVFSQTIPMMGQRRRTRFDNFLTGVYAIVGFKHTMSNSTVESDFVLARRNLKILDSASTAGPMELDDYEEAGITLPIGNTPQAFDILRLPIATEEESAAATQVNTLLPEEPTPTATTVPPALPNTPPIPVPVPEALEMKIDNGFREASEMPPGYEPLPMDILDDQNDALKAKPSDEADLDIIITGPREPGWYSPTDENGNPVQGPPVYYPGDNF